ncbi:MAG: S-layer homology domain-containing protein, partial [Selenomonas sp.]|nr:S-layer homology domain-containing protein [Selenomonas sp.]
MKKAALFGISLLMLSQLNGTADAEILNEKALQLAAENNALAQADIKDKKKETSHKTFADVKASHWSYQAVKQLTEAGLVDGFDDGMFHGDRNLSRYEMAVIISRAMDKAEQADAQQKIIIQALQDEYSKELKNIGAQIEELKQKVDRVQFHGYFGTRYDNVHGMAVASDAVMKKTTQLSVDTQYRFDKHTMITVSTTFNRSFKSEQADYTNLGALQWVDYNNRGYWLKFGRYATTMGYGLMFNDEKIQGVELGFGKGKKLSGRLTIAQYKPVTSIEADTDNDFTNNLSSHNLHPALV